MIKSYINGIESILFYDERVSSEIAPTGYPYMYHLRHDEDNWCEPISIEKFVFVNFFGTVFMKKSVEIGDDGYVGIDSFGMEGGQVQFGIDKELVGEMLDL